MLAAAAGRIPVIVDGFIVAAAALLACSLDANVREYLIPSHRSREPGHMVALRALGLDPMFDLDLRLGEASGSGACNSLRRGGHPHGRRDEDLRRSRRFDRRRRFGRNVISRALEAIRYFTVLPLGRGTEQAPPGTELFVYLAPIGAVVGGLAGAAALGAGTFRAPRDRGRRRLRALDRTDRGAACRRFSGCE